jgi:hypothetical protein
MKTIKLKYITGIILFFGIIIISFPLYYAFSPDITNYTSRIKFDQSKWKDWQETETTPCLRWDMTHDLIRKHKLKGLNVSEIIDLLGEPNRRNKKELRYYLGMSRYGIDTGSLILTIENDKVIDFEIWHG